MNEGSYRSLLVLFGLVVACTALSAVLGIYGIMPPWFTVCCMALSMYVKGGAAIWLSIFYRASLMAIMLYGLYSLLARLWKTHCFVSNLNAASMATPPARLARLIEDLGLSSHVMILFNEKPFAFCYGLLRPRICFSTSMADALTDGQLKAVLSHEDHHRRRFDPLRTLLLEVIRSLLFFLPVVTELSDLILTSFELKADRYAAQVAGRASLAGALYQILSHPLNSHLPETLAIRGFSTNDARVAQLLGESQSTFRLSTRSLMVSSLLLFLVCILA